LKLRRFFPNFGPGCGPCGPGPFPPGPVLGIQQPDFGGCPPVKPGHVLPAQTLPAQYSPVQQSTQFNQQDVYVPVYHPCHTTQINQTNYKYVHFFPQTESVVNQATQQNVYGNFPGQYPATPTPYPYYK
jgi:hypothetical protein